MHVSLNRRQALQLLAGAAGTGVLAGCAVAPPVAAPRIFALKAQFSVRAVGGGALVTYTPWRRPPGQMCWVRVCCFPRRIVEIRLVLCAFRTVADRALERNPIWCVPVTPWAFSHFLPAAKITQFRTLPPPEVRRAAGGPPPNRPAPGGGGRSSARSFAI